MGLAGIPPNFTPITDTPSAAAKTASPTRDEQNLPPKGPDAGEEDDDEEDDEDDEDGQPAPARISKAV